MTTTTLMDTSAVGTGSPPRRARWPRLLAVAVIVQPLLIAVNGVFHPEVDISGEGLLNGALEGPDTWYAVHMIAALGALLGAPAAFGLRRLVRGRGRRLADVAVVASLVAATLLAMAFAAEASVLRVAATADIPPAAAVAVAEAYASAPEFYATGLGVAVATLAGILFGVALFRDGRVPRWMPCVLLLGSVVSLGAAPGTIIGPIAFGLVALAGVGLGRLLFLEAARS